MEFEFLSKNFFLFGMSFLISILALLMILLIVFGVSHDLFFVEYDERFFLKHGRKVKILLSILFIMAFCFSFFVGFLKN